MNHHSMQLHCLIERDHDLYVGYCLDLGLGVQGDSAAEVHEALHEAINAYLQRVTEIARAGDAAGALRLLRRRAPWGLRIKYWLVWLLTRWPRLSERHTRLWAERHPDPRACCH